MRRLVFLLLVPLSAVAADKPSDVDPNTKIQGGADVRGSGANAGAGANTAERRKEEDAEMQKQQKDKDKPTSERKPREAEPKERPLQQPQ
jgi:hypothetical protein